MRNSVLKIEKLKKVGCIFLSITCIPVAGKWLVKSLQKKIEIHQVSKNLCVPKGFNRGFFSPKIIRSDNSASEQSQIHTRLVKLREEKGSILNFIHIPKTAGTSVEKAMGLKPQGHFKRYNQDLGCYQFLNTHHLTPEQALSLQLDNRQAYQKNITFAIVRNPYTRIVSDYQYMLEKHIIGPDTSLDTFIEAYAEIVRAQTEEGLIPSNYHDHATPQSKFIYFNNGIKAIREVLRFESLAKDWENFTKKYPEFKIPSSLPHENQSGKSKEKIKLTTIQKEKIYQIYQEDFESLGYAK